MDINALMTACCRARERGDFYLPGAGWYDNSSPIYLSRVNSDVLSAEFTVIWVTAWKQGCALTNVQLYFQEDGRIAMVALETDSTCENIFAKPCFPKEFQKQIAKYMAGESISTK